MQGAKASGAKKELIGIDWGARELTHHWAKFESCLFSKRTSCCNTKHSCLCSKMMWSCMDTLSPDNATCKLSCSPVYVDPILP